MVKWETLSKAAIVNFEKLFLTLNQRNSIVTDYLITLKLNRNISTDSKENATKTKAILDDF